MNPVWNNLGRWNGDSCRLNTRFRHGDPGRLDVGSPARRYPGQVSIAATTVPAGTQLDIFTSLQLSANITIKPGETIPTGTTPGQAQIPIGQAVSQSFFITGGTISISSAATPTLMFAVPVSSATLKRGVAISFAFSNSAAVTVSSSWTLSAAITLGAQTTTASAIHEPGPDGITISKGTVLAAGTIIPQGSTLDSRRKHTCRVDLCSWQRHPNAGWHDASVSALRRSRRVPPLTFSQRTWQLPAAVRWYLLAR